MISVPASRSIGYVGLLVCTASWGGLSLGCSNRDSVGSGFTDGTPVPDASVFDATAVVVDSGPPEETSTSVVDAGEDAADASDANGCSYGSQGEPLDLRCAGLYSDWATKTVSPDVHEYDPGLHLWSDGAVKTRWIYLPPNAPDGGPARIDTSDMDEWTFPVGTKLFKEFVLGGKRVETRMLWKQGDNSNWYLTTYQWSPDETMATEFTDGELDADGNGYEIPAQYLCHQCHGGRKDIVLGFEAVSLASANATPITMGTLIDAGWITNAPDASLAIPGNAADVAALGYLHANCGTSCHNPNGEASQLTFYMRLKAANLGTVQATDTWLTGVNQQSRFTIPGDPTYSDMRIAPYDAGASCVHFRMSVRDGVDDAGSGLQMPKIDSHKVDDAGIATITQWINQGCK
jgi:hypothetical protein